MALTGGGVAALLVVLFLLPAPNRVMTEGVVWLPEEAQLRARHRAASSTQVRLAPGAVVPAARPC